MSNNNNKNPTQSGDVLWKQDIYAKDGDSQFVAAKIEVTASGNAALGSGACGTKMALYTATAGGVLTKAFEVDNTQSAATQPVFLRTKTLHIPVCGNAKVGATAGWVITGGTNICHATLPAGVTGGTLVVPISGLEIGDTVTAVAACGQVESGGNVVSATLDVRKLTLAAGALVDASLATDQASYSEDTVMDSATLGVTGLTEVLAATESLYALITATTAASTDIDLSHLTVTVLRSS